MSTPDDNPLKRQKAAESISGSRITWLTPTEGAALCPLEHECRVFIDDNPVPNFNCKHVNCQSDLKAWTAQLIEACKSLSKLDGAVARKTPEQKAAEKHRDNLNFVEWRTRTNVLPSIIAAPGVPVEHWLNISPVQVDPKHPETWKLLLAGLYMPEDTVWCGYMTDTGHKFYTLNFRTMERWMDYYKHPGPHVCPSIFYPKNRTTNNVLVDQCNRSAKEVRVKPYWVLESDTMPKEKFGLVINYVQHKFAMKLRAVIATGGKSIHAWFDAPSTFNYSHGKPSLLEDHPVSPRLLESSQENHKRRHITLANYRKLECLRAALVGLGCDRQLFYPASTCRLPGCPRRADQDEGEIVGWQSLLYLDPKYDL